MSTAISKAPAGYADALARCNDGQRKAIESDARSLLILAGPGTGKTHTLTLRIARQINERGVSGSSILALTFTRRAAGEMRERLATLVPEREAKNVTIGTFHAFALSLVADWPETLGFRSAEAIIVYDEIDREDLVRRIAAGLAHGDLAKAAAKVALAILDDRGTTAAAALAELGSSVAHEYRAALSRHNALDFDMLVPAALRLLTDSPDALRRVRERYHSVFVDEFQDTDPTQRDLLVKLVCENPLGRLTVVGDVDQGIYAFRGADPGIMLSFSEWAPESSLVTLSVNYRSTPQIVAAANALIEKNENRYDKPLVAHAEDGMPIEDGRFPSPEAEAEAIARRICLLANDWKTYSPGDFAVLARTNRQLTVLADELADRSIPHRVVTPYDLWRATCVKRVQDAMRLCVNRWDEYAARNLLRWPVEIMSPDQIAQASADAVRRGIALSDAIREACPAFDRMMTTLTAMNAPAMNASEFVASVDGWLPSPIDDESRERLGRWTGKWRGKFSGSVRAFLSWAATRRVEDDIDPDEDTVKLMTAHAAKGLEWPVVVVMGCQDGSFPSGRAATGPEREEERRVFYVALTRGALRVILTWCAGGERAGKTTSLNSQSPFISEAGL